MNDLIILMWNYACRSMKNDFCTGKGNYLSYYTSG